MWMKKTVRRKVWLVVALLICFSVTFATVAVATEAVPAREGGRISADDKAPDFAEEMDALQAGEMPQQMGDVSILQERGTYTVAYTTDYAPFSYIDSNGNVAGMAVEIMNYIAQVAEIQVEYVSVDEARQYDIPVDISLAILSEDQLDGVDVRSASYTSLQMMAISQTVPIDTQDATIGHLAYSYLENDALEKALPGCVAYSYFTYSEMAQDFMAGNLDYMLATSLLASQMLETTEQMNTYSVPTAVNLNLYMSFADSLSQDEVDAFDGLIRSLDGDYVYSLMLSSVINGSDTEITWDNITEQYGDTIVITVLVIFGVIAAMMLAADRSKQKALEHIINVDELTGVMTERKFMLEVEKRLKLAKAGEYYIVTIDIDHFKFINEIYGYDVGSKTIVLFSQMLREMFPADTLIARYFADNFVIFLQVIDEAVYVQKEAEFGTYITKSMADLLGETYSLTTSCGVYQVNNTALSLSYMIDCANVARVRGKGNYGVSKMEFTKQLDYQIQQKNEIVRSMEQAISQREFQVYYQPKISLQDESLVGAEALVRWVCADGRRRFPDEFIPVFESNGFIRKVDLFVLEAVCQFIQSNPTAPKISVNFSGLTMLEEDLLERVEQILADYGVSAKRLEIEITESAVVQNFEPIVRQTAKLKALGFAVSMDDFGAGISSLNRLKDLDIDVLKIDKAFLGEELLGERSISIIEHILNMAHQLGIATIAEGVEHSQQVEFLKALGCDAVQGYFYAKPMAQDEFLNFMLLHKKGTVQKHGNPM